MGGNSNETSFERILNSSCVNLPQLRNLSWHGIPMKYRATCWKLLLGYLPIDRNWRESHINEKRQEYNKAVAEHEPSINETKIKTKGHFRQVLLDVPRTKPELSLFSNPRVQRCLERIICIWTIGNQDLNYVQGINDLVTPFFSVFVSDYFQGKLKIHESNLSLSDKVLRDVEADTYWCLHLFLSRIRDHYTPDLPGQTRMVNALEHKMKQLDWKLHSYLLSNGLEFHLFAFKWMNCLLLRELPFHCIIRMWDTYLSDEQMEEIHVYVCSGFLQEFSNELQTKTNFEDLFHFIQRMPTHDWGEDEVEMLLSQASLWRMMSQNDNPPENDPTLIKDTQLSTSQLNKVMYDMDTLLFL